MPRDDKARGTGGEHVGCGGLWRPVYPVPRPGYLTCKCTKCGKLMYRKNRVKKASLDNLKKLVMEARNVADLLPSSPQLSDAKDCLHKAYLWLELCK